MQYLFDYFLKLMSTIFVSELLYLNVFELDSQL